MPRPPRPPPSPPPPRRPTADADAGSRGALPGEPCVPTPPALGRRGGSKQRGDRATRTLPVPGQPAHRFRLYARTAATAAVRLASGYKASRKKLKLERRPTSIWSPDAIASRSYLEYPLAKSITTVLSLRITCTLFNRPSSVGPPACAIACAKVVPSGNRYRFG